MTVTPEQATDAANEVFGRHFGFRALHAKGTLLKGTFNATPEAAALSTAAHLQGGSIPVTVRVSNGAGNPRAADYAPDVRGLGVKFYLPDETRTDIVAQTAPWFPVHTPEGFVELLRATKAGPAMAWRFPIFLARHPEAIPSLRVNGPALLPPRSYATCRYYAVHAYRFVDAGGDGRYVRYTWLPENEEPRLNPVQARRLGRDYLNQEIRARVARGPIRFTLQLQLAEAGDPVDDPHARWPGERRRVNAGTLEITALETERETDGDVLVFDPSRVTRGIELSDDPVLRFRPSAYSESVARRT